jgi:mediator of RNA polymerase II transcription subunit 17
MDSDLFLSLRNFPAPSPSPSDNAVSTIISRIQQQRGHFKDISEPLLESEIAQDASADPMDISEPDDTLPDADSEAAEKLAAAKNEMIELLGFVFNYPHPPKDKRLI